MEVKVDTDCTVLVSGSKYELGFISQIYATHPTYIVWSDDKEHVWYEIDYTKLTLAGDFHSFWARYQELRCQSLHNLEDAQKSVYKTMLASSLASALEKQIEAADASLKSAKSFLDSSNERASKRRYLIGVIVSAAIAMTISVVLYTIYYYFPVDKVIQLCATALGGGAIGALLSSTTGKIQDARFDPNASIAEGHMNGALRMLYGVCGALVAIIAVKSGAISSNFFRPESENLALFLIAVAGGFTERHAANIVTKLSPKSEGNQ